MRERIRIIDLLAFLCLSLFIPQREGARIVPPHRVIVRVKRINVGTALRTVPGTKQALNTILTLIICKIHTYIHTYIPQANIA